MFNSDGQVVTLVFVPIRPSHGGDDSCGLRDICSLVYHMHMGDLMIAMTASDGMTRMNRL